MASRPQVEVADKRSASSAVWRRGRDSNPRTPFGMLLTFQASAFDHSATSPRGRKGTGGGSGDQIYAVRCPARVCLGGPAGAVPRGAAQPLAALFWGAGL